LKLSRILIMFFVLALPVEAVASTACVVLSRDIKPYNESFKGFQKSYNGEIVEFNLHGSTKNAPEIIGKIRSSHCETLVSIGSLALKFLKLRTSKKPIIYLMSLNATPSKKDGRIITGVQLEASPHDTLKAISTLLPNIGKIGIIYTPGLTDWYIQDVVSSAKHMNLKIVAIEVNSIGETARSLPALFGSSDIVCMIPDAITSSKLSFEQMVSISFRMSVPIFGLSSKHVHRAALAALNTNYSEHGVAAGKIANRISQGHYSHTSKRQFVDQGDIVINFKTAKKLGLSFPKSTIKNAFKTID